MRVKRIQFSRIGITKSKPVSKLAARICAAWRVYHKMYTFYTHIMLFHAVLSDIMYREWVGSSATSKYILRYIIECLY